MDLSSIGAWLSGAQPAMGDDPDFSMWWGVLAAFVVAPILILSVKFYADHRRDRKTKELISASEKEGPVPDLPKDFEVPQVIPRRNRASRRGGLFR